MVLNISRDIRGVITSISIFLLILLGYYNKFYMSFIVSIIAVNLLNL